MEAIALPQKLKQFSGRITDIDTHENMPAQEWVKQFGSGAKEIADYMLHHEGADVDGTSNFPDYPGDMAVIDENIVNLKGPRAPGATDVKRRLEVMDAMGIRRQLMFPTGFAANAMQLYKFADRPTFMPAFKGDRRGAALRALSVFNEWAVDAASVSDRIRPVAMLYGNSPEEVIENARGLLKGGIRAVWIFPAGEPLGGRTPAHPDLDPLWAMLAEANCAATVHVAGDGKFFATDHGKDAPAFEGFIQHVELSRDPWFLSTLHSAFENFLVVMLLGGVFERHPNLRFGIIEATANWVGPMIRRLDMWYGVGMKIKEVNRGQTQFKLANPPSFYLKRNVRVTPFIFEDFVHDIEVYGLDDVLCFSTDYPHAEGGKDFYNVYVKKSVSLSTEKAEKFFVKNGELLLPD